METDERNEMATSNDKPCRICGGTLGAPKHKSTCPDYRDEGADEESAPDPCLAGTWLDPSWWTTWRRRYAALIAIQGITFLASLGGAA